MLDVGKLEVGKLEVGELEEGKPFVGISESLDWTRLQNGNKNGGARPHGTLPATPKASGALNLSGPPETVAISLYLVYFLKSQCLLTTRALTQCPLAWCILKALLDTSRFLI